MDGDIRQRAGALRCFPGRVAGPGTVPLTAFPIALIGEKINVVIVGCGRVGARKALAFHDAGATVRVISPDATAELSAAAASSERISVELREYAGVADIADAEIVVAATGTSADQRVADDARSLHRLVVVAGDPKAGNYTSMSIHRAGSLAIGVSAGGVPGMAIRIRDEIAERFDSRYGDVLTALAEIRAKTLDDGGTTEWTDEHTALIGEDFCDRVESGTMKKDTE
ncbi:MAG: NAD(P)-dependent oxidoreductase [Gemmatimonadales bacterium]